jgi:hypothetical protein
LRGEISVESCFLCLDWIVVVTAVVAVRKATRAEKGKRIEVVVKEGTPPLASAVEGYGSNAIETGAHLPAASTGTFAVRIRTRVAESQTPLGNLTGCCRCTKDRSINITSENDYIANSNEFKTTSWLVEYRL